MRLEQCVRCKRHIQTRERTCPFCKLAVGALLCVAGTLMACDTKTTTATSASDTPRSTTTTSVASAVEAELSVKKRLEEEQRRLREQVDMYGMAPPMPKPSASASTGGPKSPDKKCACDKADPLCDCQ